MAVEEDPGGAEAAVGGGAGAGGVEEAEGGGDLGGDADAGVPGELDGFGRAGAGGEEGVVEGAALRVFEYDAPAVHAGADHGYRVGVPDLAEPLHLNGKGQKVLTPGTRVMHVRTKSRLISNIENSSLPRNILQVTLVNHHGERRIKLIFFFFGIY